VGLLELFIVDLLDLDELWMRERSQLRRREKAEKEGKTHLDVGSVGEGHGSSEGDDSQGGSEGEGESASEHLEETLEGDEE
jgi:hypothetical protein